MSTAQLTLYWCDLCGYGGRSASAHWFESFPGGVVLCRWCSQVGPVRLEGGGHRVEFTAGSWSCSCGGEFWGAPLLAPRHVVEVVPDLLLATANIHVNAGPVELAAS